MFILFVVIENAQIYGMVRSMREYNIHRAHFISFNTKMRKKKTNRKIIV